MKLNKYLNEYMTQADLAKKLGITPGSISQWVNKDRVPAERVLQIEKATKNKVMRHDMRPDIYPKN